MRHQGYYWALCSLSNRSSVLGKGYRFLTQLVECRVIHHNAQLSCLLIDQVDRAPISWRLNQSSRQWRSCLCLDFSQFCCKAALHMFCRAIVRVLVKATIMFESTTHWSMPDQQHIATKTTPEHAHSPACGSATVSWSSEESPLKCFLHAQHA